MPSSTPVSPGMPGMAPRFPPPPQHRIPPRFWSPPPDPEKPACPYQRGFAVEIKRHTPPPPFGDPHHGPGPWQERRDVDLYSATQTEAVLAYPPLEPENTLSSSHAPTAHLTIAGTLAVGDERGAQLVVCSVTPNPSPQSCDGIVAKIFDPLYYSFECPHAAHEPVNVAWQADVDYTHEAAAFNHLDRMRKAGRTGLSAPEYYGSWTFTLPITHAGRRLQRAVRLVLMENIKGPSIQSLCHDPVALSHYSEPDRLDIFAMALDAIVKQRHSGLDQRDLAPRNVVLRPSSSPSALNKQLLAQPVIVDYNAAVVFELSRHGKRPCQLKDLPGNPMQLFWTTSFADFQGWIPSEWERTSKLRQQWLKERFGGEAATAYAPVDGELEFETYY